MDVLTYAHVRQHLAEIMDEVCAGRAPVVVTRQGAEPIVMISLEEEREIAEDAAAAQ